MGWWTDPGPFLTVIILIFPTLNNSNVTVQWSGSAFPERYSEYPFPVLLAQAMSHKLEVQLTKGAAETFSLPFVNALVDDGYRPRRSPANGRSSYLILGMAFAQSFTTHRAHCFFTAFPVARCLIAVTHLTSSRGGLITTFLSVFVSAEQHHGEYSEAYGPSNHHFINPFGKRARSEHVVAHSYRQERCGPGLLPNKDGCERSRLLAGRIFMKLSLYMSRRETMPAFELDRSNSR